MQFTPQQNAAIEDRSDYLLVSAAAGAGKTAVLVQRILHMLVHDGFSLDRILIMTFTNAAASELKERIAKQLLLNVKKYPALREQYSKINLANIGTMHTFCKKIITQEYQVAGLSPKVKIGEQAYMHRMYQDALQKALRIAYTDPIAQIQSLQQCYTKQQIEDFVNNLYYAVQSFPNPMGWLAEHCGQNTAPEDISVFLPLQELYQNMIHKKQAQLEKDIETYKAFLMGFLPDKYMQIVQEDCINLQALCAETSPHKLFHLLELLTFATFRKQKGEEATGEAIAEVRNRLKTQVAELKDFVEPYLFFESDAQLAKLHLQALCHIVYILQELYSQAKRGKDIVDFNDLEHKALQILQVEELAQKIAGGFDAVFIDECQDNSYIQEEILKALKSAHNTLFMVGDVKQSIYRFRSAEPNLFIEKLNTYTQEPSTKRKILLNQNFRSNPTVIDACNRVFSNLLEIGDLEISYKQGQDWLVAGRNDTEGVPCKFRNIVCPGGVDKLTVQASYIAKQIKALVGTKHPAQNRNIDFKDIAILCPKLKGVGELIMQYLEHEKVPFYSDIPYSVTNHSEIEQLLAWLTFMLNSFDDIAFLSILKGPAFFMPDEILAQIRLLCPHKEADFTEAFYYCASLAEQFAPTEYEGESMLQKSEVNWNPLNPHDILYTFREARKYITHREHNEVASKAGYSDVQYAVLRLCGDIRRLFSQERFMATHIPLHTYLWSFAERSGICKYYQAMKNGDDILNNMRSFCLQAKHYLRNTGGDLEDFVADCRTTQSMGNSLSPVLLSPYENLVRIMTVHKSKGLEFDIVFVMGMDLPLLSTIEQRAELSIHKRYGLAMAFRDANTHIKHDTAINLAIKNVRMQELKAERARLLYVAMTRAKEVLYLVHSDRNAEQEAKEIDAIEIANASSFGDWVRLALCHGDDFLQSFPAKEYSQDFIDSGLQAVNLQNLSQSAGFWNWDFKQCYVNTQNDIVDFVQKTLQKQEVKSLLDSLPAPVIKQTIEIEKDHFKDTRIAQEGDILIEKFSVGLLCDVLMKSDTYRLQFPISDNPVPFPKPHPVPLYQFKSIADLPGPDEMFKKQPQTAAQIGTITHFLIEKLKVPALRKIFKAGGIEHSYKQMAENFTPQTGDVFHTPVLTEERLQVLRQELKQKTVKSPELVAVMQELEAIMHRSKTLIPGRTVNFSNVDLFSIIEFYISPLGIALQNSHLYFKEKMLALYLTDWEVPILNGVIDLCFLQGDQWIIVDFKNAHLDEIPEKYKYQIAIYKLMLTLTTKYSVKECYIYSLKDGKAYRI